MCDSRCPDREAACAQHFSEYVPGRYLHRGRLQIVAISSADDGVQFRGQKQSTGDNPRRRFISSVECALKRTEDDFETRLNARASSVGASWTQPALLRPRRKVLEAGRPNPAALRYL